MTRVQNFIKMARGFCNKSVVDPICDNIVDETLHCFFENKSSDRTTITSDCIIDLIYDIVFYVHNGKLSEMDCYNIARQIHASTSNVLKTMIDYSRLTYYNGRYTLNDKPFIIITTKYGKVLRPVFIDKSVAWF